MNAGDAHIRNLAAGFLYTYTHTHDRSLSRANRFVVTYVCRRDQRRFRWGRELIAPRALLHLENGGVTTGGGGGKVGANIAAQGIYDRP